MKSIAQVKREYPDKAKLINAVVSRIGKDSIMDVVNHGADAGYSGFTYYSDTCSFYRKHRADINQWIKDTFSDYGYKSAVEMVKNFNCAKDEEEENIGRCIYGGRLNGNDETMNVMNCLAWFALEEVCRLFEN